METTTPIEGSAKKKIRLESYAQKEGLFCDENKQRKLDKDRDDLIERQRLILNSRAQRKEAAKLNGL